ncbi:hypothetical protein BDW72DRAFT_194642 [Aspergillus terricola var. indicus]
MRSIALSFALAGTLLAQSSQALVQVVTSTRVECSSVSTNLLSDASFETGELGAWTPWFGTSTVVNDHSDAGEYALTITSPSSPYRSIRQTVTGLTVGTSYTLSFDYRIKELLLVQSTATCLMYLEYDGNRILASGSYSYVPGVTPEWTTISGTLTASAAEHSFVMWGYCGTTTLHGPVLEFDNARFERPLVDGEPTESCSTLTNSSTVTYTPTLTPTPSPNPTRTPTPSPMAPASLLTTTTPSSTPLIAIPPSSVPTSPSVTPSRAPSRIPVTRSSSIPFIAPSSKPENTFTQILIYVPTPSPVRSPSVSPVRSPISAPAVPASSSRPIPAATTVISTSIGSTSTSMAGSLSTTTSLPTFSPPIEDVTSATATLPTITAGHGSPADTASSPSLITSTVFSTRTATITACPASVTDCPASSTYLTIETVYVSTTICPVANAAPTKSVPHGDSSSSGNGSGNGGSNSGDSLSPSLSTSTVLSTRIVTITACPQTVTDCPARSTFVSTETLVASTTVVTVIPNTPVTATALPIGSYGSVPYPGGSNAGAGLYTSPAGSESTRISSSGSSSGSPSEFEPLTAPKQGTKIPSNAGAVPRPPPFSGSAYYPTHSSSAIPSSISSSLVSPEPSTLVSVSATGSATMTITTTTPAGAEFTGSASAFKQNILLIIGAASAPLFLLFF